MLKMKPVAVLVSSVLTLNGCATINQEKFKKDAADMRAAIDEQVASHKARGEMPLMKKVSGAYLGSETISLAYDATLPAAFRETTLRFPSRANLTTVAARITEATKIPVRIRPDVSLTGRQGQPGASGASERGNSADAALPGGTVPALPSPGSRLPSNSIGIAAQTFDEFDASLPMDYVGPLAGYLDRVTARLGINWEYRDGTIHLYRLVTKVFPVKVNPGKIEVKSSVEKGGSANTGAQGGANATTTGNFNSESSTKVESEYSVWEVLKNAIDGMKSPLGKATIDEAAGHVIITDTREVVEEVGRLIDIQNAALTRQVEISVRILKVALNDNDELGLDLSAAYTRLATRGTNFNFALTPPSTLSGGDGAGLGLGIVSPSSRWNGTAAVANALNSIGTIVSDETISAGTTNRLPVPIGKFTTQAYLAQTTPATGGTTGAGGAGVPGLTPGSVTTGFFLSVLPTALENNSVLMRISLDQSDLLNIGTISTGSGATLQQIQTPQTTGYKSDHSIGLREGESVVLMGITRDTSTANSNRAFNGFSNTGKKSREIQVIIVTPKVRPGV